jgi:hypothetical protein
MDRDHAASLAKSIAQGLVPQPAYLLIFGIFAVAIFIGSLIGRPDGNTFQYVVILTLAAFGSALIAILIISRFTTKGEQVSVTGDSALDEQLSQVSKAIQNALQVKNQTLTLALTRRIEALAEEAGIWKKGQLRAEGNAYPAILINLYQQANNSVFSTSIPRYLFNWKDALGKRILDTNRENKRATTTRVFAFKSRVEVDEDAKDIMREQHTCGVRVFVFLAEDHPEVEFPRDFTIIDDGAAIGETFSFDEDDVGCIWHFNDQAKTRLYRSMRTDLLRYSIAFDQFDTRPRHPAPVGAR